MRWFLCSTHVACSRSLIADSRAQDECRDNQFKDTWDMAKQEIKIVTKGSVVPKLGDSSDPAPLKLSGLSGPASSSSSNDRNQLLDVWTKDTLFDCALDSDGDSAADADGSSATKARKTTTKSSHASSKTPIIKRKKSSGSLAPKTGSSPNSKEQHTGDAMRSARKLLFEIEEALSQMREGRYLSTKLSRKTFDKHIERARATLSDDTKGAINEMEGGDDIVERLDKALVRLQLLEKFVHSWDFQKDKEEEGRAPSLLSAMDIAIEGGEELPKAHIQLEALRRSLDTCLHDDDFAQVHKIVTSRDESLRAHGVLTTAIIVAPDEARSAQSALLLRAATHVTGDGDDKRGKAFADAMADATFMDEPLTAACGHLCLALRPWCLDKTTEQVQEALEQLGCKSHVFHKLMTNTAGGGALLRIAQDVYIDQL